MRRTWREVNGQQWEIWGASGNRRWEVALKFSKAPWGRCRWCGKTIMKKGEPDLRRRWHKECHSEFTFQLYPQEARAQVYKRDLGVCRGCRRDTRMLEQILRKERHKPHSERREHAILRSLGFNLSSSLWQADHIIRIADGGEHSLENLQTLCQICHKDKTANENRKLTEEEP